MNQDFLYRLTGRRGDFLEPLMNHGDSGSTPGNAALREWLGLHNRKTDIHVRALLVAADAFPEDSGLSGLNFRTEWLSPELTDIVGAQLVGNGASPAVIAYQPAVFPFATDWELHYHSANEARLVQGTVQRIVRVSPGGDTMPVSWPTDTGIKGNLKLHQSWDPGALVFMHVPARSYPYQALMDALRRRTDAVALLAAKAVADGAFTCPNPVRAAAMVVKALTT